MHVRELVDLIRSGPASLKLFEPIRSHYEQTIDWQHRSNPCDFNDLLQALRCNETIQDLWLGVSTPTMDISEEQWVSLVKTIGSMKGIKYLALKCAPGSRDFDPFHAVADAVNNAHSLIGLILSIDWISSSFPNDPSGVFALAKALREHTNLQEFTWNDLHSRDQLRAMNSATVDPVLRAVPVCPHLQKVTIFSQCGSTDAMKNLLQLQTTTELNVRLNMEQLLAVADEIRCGRCRVVSLDLGVADRATRSEVTEGIKAVASAIVLDQTLEHLTLHMEDMALEIQDLFTDEAGVALAEALTINKHLRTIELFDATLGVRTYEAFSATLRVNTSLILKLPPFKRHGADEKLVSSWKQMVIEQRLNEVGRGRLLASSSRATREEYLHALHRLDFCDDDDDDDDDDAHAFRISCLYSLLRLNPSLICVSRKELNAGTVPVRPFLFCSIL
jgi:hypothetical protein